MFLSNPASVSCEKMRARKTMPSYPDPARTPEVTNTTPALYPEFYPYISNPAVNYSPMHHANYNAFQTREKDGSLGKNTFNCLNTNARNATYANCSFNTDPRAYFGVHYGMHIFDTNDVRGGPMNPRVKKNEWPEYFACQSYMT